MPEETQTQQSFAMKVNQFGVKWNGALLVAISILPILALIAFARREGRRFA